MAPVVATAFAAQQVAEPVLPRALRIADGAVDADAQRAGTPLPRELTQAGDECGHNDSTSSAASTGSGLPARIASRVLFPQRGRSRRHRHSLQLRQ